MSNNDQQNQNSFGAILATLPNTGQMTAYQMAKLCCEYLLQQEQPIPSWIGIRQIIGKGSAQDINRAKKDFLNEQLRTARRSQLAVDYLPETLATHVQQLWEAAIDQAEKNMALKFKEIRDKNEELWLAFQDVQHQHDQALTRAKAAESELLFLKSEHAQLKGRLQGEMCAREQAEAVLQNLNEEKKSQKDALQNALSLSNQEVKKALDRLEAMEERALLEINRIKTESQAIQSRLEEKIKHAHAEHIIEHTKAQQAYDRLNASYQLKNEQHIKAEQQCVFLEEKVRFLQTQLEKMQDTQQQWLESIKPDIHNKTVLKKQKRIR